MHLFTMQKNVIPLIHIIIALCINYPTSPFPISEPPNPWIDDFFVVKERRATDFKLQNCERARRVES